MMRKMNPTKKINAGGKRFDKYLVRMKCELQPCFKKVRYLPQEIFQIFSVLGQDYKIIGVANAIANFQLPLQKLIECIHIDIYQKLACEIAKRQADTGHISCMKAVDNFTEKPEHVFVLNVLPQNIFQNCMIDAREKLLHVALQNPRGSRMILRDFTCVFSEPIHGTVCTFIKPAGIRIKNEFPVEIWV